jgi:beta-lactamase class A
MPKSVLIFSLALLGLAAVAAGAATPETDVALEQRLRETGAMSKGVLGVAAVLLDGGRHAALNGGERFPMASTFKLPVALTVLGRADEGMLRLGEPVEVKASDLRPGPLTVIEAEWKPGKTWTIEELLRVMIVESGNSAADVLLRVLGGPPTVTDRLRALGLEGVDVSRSEAELAFDFYGVASPPPRESWTLEGLRRVYVQAPDAVKRAAAERFIADSRDSASPEAMAALLARFARGELLKPESTRRLNDLLLASTPGPGRLKGLLPQGTPVAHKTGTCGDAPGLNCTNDVGIIELPGNRRAVVAAYLKNATKSDAARERTLAEAARAVYDAWAQP